MSNAANTREGANYLAITLAALILAVPGVIGAAALVAQGIVYPRVANVFDPSLPLRVSLIGVFANIASAVGVGIITYGFAFRAIAAQPERGMWPYLHASAWGLVGLYLGLHAAVAAFHSGSAPALVLVGPAYYVAVSFVFTPLYAVGFLLGAVTAGVAITLLMAVLYWKLDRVPAFGVGRLGANHLKAAVVAAVASAALGIVFMMVSYPRLFGFSTSLIWLAHFPLSVAGAVTTITVLSIAASVWGKQGRGRVALLGWVVVFAAGFSLLSFCEVAVAQLLGLVAGDAKSASGAGTFVGQVVSKVPREMMGGALAALVYAWLLGARDWRFVSRVTEDQASAGQA
jgi:hypothetical protein